MEELKYAYIAGLLDGEGTIGIRYYQNTTGQFHYRPIVEINNTSKEMIDYVVNVFGYSSYWEKPKKKRRKVQWVWRVNGARCGEVLKYLVPYLITKKDRATLCIDFCKRLTRRGYSWTEEFRQSENTERKKYFDKLKLLNE